MTNNPNDVINSSPVTSTAPTNPAIQTNQQVSPVRPRVPLDILVKSAQQSQAIATDAASISLSKPVEIITLAEEK